MDRSDFKGPAEHCPEPASASLTNSLALDLDCSRCNSAGAELHVGGERTAHAVHADRMLMLRKQKNHTIR